MGMVDVGEKQKTRRIAKAQTIVKLNKEIISKIKNKKIPKGDVLETAKIAGILAVKKTAEIIPLCHNIEIESAYIKFKIQDENIIITSTIRAYAKTGVEMEALTACSVSALTIYDMCKMFSKTIEINSAYLLEKQGGKSGDYKRDEK